MAFNCELKTINAIATISVSGELDRKAAPDFQAKVEEASKQDITALVIDMNELEYMASAGLRVLIFAKQHMPNVTVYVVGAQELVADTIEKTGFNESIVMLSKYDAAIIEKN